MWSIVIPAYNEEGRIGQVLANLSVLPVDHLIVIANGCQDGTVEEVRRFRDERLDLRVFEQKLGVDVPRAVGAKIAYEYRSQGVLFVDGDMTGNFTGVLLQLMERITDGWDMALLNCYPVIPYRPRDSLSQLITYFRAKLNRKLNLFDKLGIASPSHGPHALSRRLLETVPFRELAVPPVSLVLARQAGLQIGVAAGIPHRELQSKTGDARHWELTAQTIIGDCLEALCLLDGKPRSRLCHGVEMLGYHPERNWELLQAFLDSYRS